MVADPVEETAVLLDEAAAVEPDPSDVAVVGAPVDPSVSEPSLPDVDSMLVSPDVEVPEPESVVALAEAAVSLSLMDVVRGSSVVPAEFVVDAPPVPAEIPNGVAEVAVQPVRPKAIAAVRQSMFGAR